jgi:hypothetical protein
MGGAFSGTGKHQAILYLCLFSNFQDSVNEPVVLLLIMQLLREYMFILL